MVLGKAKHSSTSEGLKEKVAKWGVGILDFGRPVGQWHR
jgi:hypothetical protein